MRSKLSRAILLHAAAFTASLTLCASVSAQTPSPTPGQISHSSAIPDRIAPHPNLTPTVRLAGHVPTWANAASDAGPVDPGLKLDHLLLTLRRDPASEAAFQQLLADQQDPRSPRHHHWLTPAESGRLYGPSANDIAAVTAWLTAQGLHVDAVSPTGISVTFSGASATVARAFSTTFRSFHHDGGTRYAATSEPSVPTALAPVLGSFVGLSEQYFHSHASFQTVPMPTPLAFPSSAPGGAFPQYTSGTTHFISPQDFAVLYDLTPAYNSGINGSGYRVAVIGGSRVVASDITVFETLSGLPPSTPNLVILPSGSDPGPTASSSQGEATLDVDRVLATAPGAGVDLLVTSNALAFTNTIALLNYEISTLNDPIVNMSFGACEASAGTNTAAFNTLFTQGAAQGITWVASSGDSGAAGCDASFSAPPTSQFLNADFICASSYVTCVGGTQFADTTSPSKYWATTNGTSLSSALSYIPEGAWNEPTLSANMYLVGATGGGASTVIAKPSWQTGVGVPADGFRDTPDVAFSASNHDGYLGCLAYAKADCVTSIEIFSGTSAAAPSMAGIVAMVDQKLGLRQGNLNPSLYRLAANTSNGVFHDATPASSGVAACTTTVPSPCNNSSPSTYALTGGLAGYALTTGYDQATGWGSIDVNNLLTALFVTTGGFTVNAYPTTLTLTAGTTSGNTALLTYASGGGFAGTITQTCSVAFTGSGAVNYIPTCTFSTATVTLPANGSVSSTITIGSTVPHVLTSNVAPRPQPGLQRGEFPASKVPASAFALSLLAFCMLPRRRLRRAVAAAVRSHALLLPAPLVAPVTFAIVATLILATLSGCASPSSPGTPQAPLIGTTTGGYTVTITGTSGSTSVSTTLALNIQ